MRFCFKMAVRRIAGDKKKSIPLFFCMFLAMFLLVSLFGLYESYEQMILEDTKESYGAYHFYLRNALSEWKEILLGDSSVDRVGTETLIGSAALTGFNGGSVKEGQTIRLTGMDSDGMTLDSLRLKSGRLPEKEGEILISAGVELGDGYAYDKAEEGGTLRLQDSNGKEKEYRIVGVLDNFDAAQEDDVYTGHVRQKESGETCTFYVSLKDTSGEDTSGVDEAVQRIAKRLGIGEDEIYRLGNRLIDTEDSLAKYRLVVNSELIGLLKDGSSDDKVRSVEIITWILIVFVILVAALIIWNIYLLLLEQRKADFGFLRICGMSPAGIYATAWLESGILCAAAVLLGALAGTGGKLMTQGVVQSFRTASLEELEMTISASVLAVSAGVIIFVVFATVTLLTCVMMKDSPMEMMNGTKQEKQRRKKKRGGKNRLLRTYEPTAEFLVGMRNIFRRKGRTAGVVLSLAVVVVFFVTCCSFAEVLDSQVVTDVTMIPPCQYALDTQKIGQEISEDFIKSIPFTEFKYTASHSSAYFHIGPEIKDQYMLNHYNDYHAGDSNEEVFNQSKVYVEISGVSEKMYEELTWFEGDPMTYEEWVDSGKALMDDIYVETDEEGEKTYRHLLTIDTTDYELEYDEMDTEWENGERTHFPAGSVTLGGRVGLRLYCREDDAVYFLLLFPEETVRKTYDPYSQTVYINAEKGKETELGAWLRRNSLKYNYSITDDVKKYAAAHDTQTTVRVVLWGVMAAVAFISMFHIYNTVKSSLTSRKKELAVLMALGMRRFQIRKSVLWEHAAYGVLGGALGCGLSILLLHKLLKILSGAAKVSTVIPWDYLAIGFCGVILMSMLVSVLATVHLAETSIVEEIREND